MERSDEVQSLKSLLAAEPEWHDVSSSLPDVVDNGSSSPLPCTPGERRERVLSATTDQPRRWRAGMDATYCEWKPRGWTRSNPPFSPACDSFTHAPIITTHTLLGVCQHAPPVTNPRAAPPTSDTAVTSTRPTQPHATRSEQRAHHQFPRS